MKNILLFPIYLITIIALYLLELFEDGVTGET